MKPPRHRKPLLSRVRRDMYLTQRGIGDFQAASRGPVPLARRLARRKATRSVFGGLRRKGLW